MARSKLLLSGSVEFRYVRPDGTLGWVRQRKNAVTDQGVNWILDCNFASLAPPAAVYIGLINNAGYTGDDPTDTHTSHPGWSEWTGISSATRPTWIPMPANGGLMGTSSPAVFNITSDGDIRGCFLSTVSTVGSVAAGYLYNTVITLTELPVEIGGVLYVTPSVRIGE